MSSHANADRRPPPRKGSHLALVALLLTPLGGLAQTATEPQAATAQNVEPPPVVAPPPTQVGVKDAAIDAWLPPDQLLWLETDGVQFPARYRAALVAAPRGAVLILHDAGQHPSWPTTLAALFEELPRHGWHTLAIALPAPAVTATAGGVDVQTTPAAVEPTAAGSGKPPTSGAPAAASAEPPTAEATPAAAPPAPIEPEAQARARVSAALSHFEREAPTAGVVLAGFGNGAVRALDLASTTPAPAPVAALVLADFPVLDGAAAAATRQQLAGLALPILDIQQGADTLAAEQAELRQLIAQKTPARLYTRLQLPTLAAPAADSTSPLVRRIRGWLQRNLTGKAT